MWDQTKAAARMSAIRTCRGKGKDPALGGGKTFSAALPLRLPTPHWAVIRKVPGGPFLIQARRQAAHWLPILGPSRVLLAGWRHWLKR